MQEFIDKCNQNPEILIDGFFREYRWLSNFEIAPVKKLNLKVNND